MKVGESTGTGTGGDRRRLAAIIVDAETGCLAVVENRKRICVVTANPFVILHLVIKFRFSIINVNIVGCVSAVDDMYSPMYSPYSPTATAIPRRVCM